MLKQELVLLRYNKNVVCVIETNQTPVCYSTSVYKQLSSYVTYKKIPVYDLYIPRQFMSFYDCSKIICQKMLLTSLLQVTSPNLKLHSCYSSSNGRYKCETIRYNYLKNIDKLLFLSASIPDKTFYLADCLVYNGGGRICHAKDDVDSHTKLVDAANMVRPNEPNILSQDEFICEESPDKEVVCDLNPYVPFPTGLKPKNAQDYQRDILLKTGTYVIPLRFSCDDNWCGYKGNVDLKRTRRSRYESTIAGGMTYRCYYAKKQQICKPLITNTNIYYEDIQRLN